MHITPKYPRKISTKNTRNKDKTANAVYIYLSLSISTYICLCLSISVYIYLSLSISTYIYPYLSISIYISISIYLYLSLCISIYLYLYLSLSVYIYFYLYLSISIYIYLYLSISIYILALSKWSPYPKSQEFPALAALSKCFRRSGADVGWQSRDWPRENQSLVLQSMAPGVSEKMWYSPKPAIGSWVIKLLEASGNLSTQKGAEFVVEFGLIGCSQVLATPDCAGNFSLGTLWVAQSLSLVGTTLSPSPTLLQFDVEASSDCSPPRQTGGGWC